MRFVLGVLLGLAAGFIVARYLLPENAHSAFETAEPILLSDEKGVQLAQIPAGRLVLSLTARGFEPDTGWWGCVPVLFSDGFQAREVLRPASGWRFDSGPVISGHRLQEGASGHRPR